MCHIRNDYLIIIIFFISKKANTSNVNIFEYNCSIQKIYRISISEKQTLRLNVLYKKRIISYLVSTEATMRYVCS